MCKINNLSIEPFSKFSAEEELDILNEIFYQPAFYVQLRNLIVDGNSRFILGQRGQGKSAIIYKLFEDLSKHNSLPLLITRYDGVPLNGNSNHFLYLIIKNITLGLAKMFSVNNGLLKHTSKCKRTKFYVMLEMFYDTKWSPDFVETAKVIKKKKQKRLLASLFNKHIKVLNRIIEGGIRLTAEEIRRTFFGETAFNFDDSFRDYFSFIEVEDFHHVGIEEASTIGTDELINMLRLLLDISNDIGLKSVIVLFDKIDECPKLNSDVECVSEFLRELLSDTDFLYTQNLGVVFSLWSEVKRNLNNKGIRFDKFQDIDIRWKDEDLEKIINHRLAYFSKVKSFPVKMETLIPEESTRKKVLELADKSPRSLIILLNKIFYADDRETIDSFSPEAISKGIMDFCMNFDYMSQLPFRFSKREDIYDWINKLLNARKTTFTLKEYMDAVPMNARTAQMHINEFKRLGIIRESLIPDTDNRAIYEVSDPRICYLISRGITKIES